MLQVALLCLLLASADSFTLSKNIFDKNEESSGMKRGDSGSVGRVFGPGPKGNSSDEGDFSISTLLEKANKNLGKRPTDPMIRELDIAVGYGLQNADPCTADECRWPKSRDGNVYVPYRISSQYTHSEKAIIEDVLMSFEQSTCIRFIPVIKEQDFVDIQSDDGVGRNGGPQVVSLEKNGCLHKRIIQHEMMHALGFHHEHSRSDRDQHVVILKQNIKPGTDVINFKKFRTNNLLTPYDYDSVMQYGRYFFSGNGKPTILPIPDRNVPMGMATEMSYNDILRINRLYSCY